MPEISRGFRYLPNITLRQPFNFALQGIEGNYRLPKGKIISIRRASIPQVEQVNIRTRTNLNLGDAPHSGHVGYINGKPVAFLVYDQHNSDTIFPCAGVVREAEGLQIGRLLLALSLADLIRKGSMNRIVMDTTIKGFINDLSILAPLIDFREDGCTIIHGDGDAIIKIMLPLPNSKRAAEAYKAIEKYLESAGICRVDPR